MHLEHPYRFDGRRRTASASHAVWLRGLVEQVLMTRPGERLNRPTFGSGLGQLPFDGLGDELSATTEFLVRSALQQWLGDLIQVEQVEVTSHDSTSRIQVTFQENRTGETHTEIFERRGTG
ncbi:GPW/gp25 family protein [Blastococcus saxobsidens]|uniref:IraD/Gp25-like domain-containing protein n=1 Tax=Blastococcus saxobsidens (strain DD2) TaxID=1146883 RepID=H6RPG9_BLASD|nr:GPW/gp25 family protein [Blastococcus saxobsidens]CCG04028.1 conserved protein of unknown function [Blastococcus saxobsidens DD2]